MSNPLKAIEHISKGNSKEKKELLTLFIKETTQRLKTIQQQAKSNDWKQVQKTAHTFISTFLYLNIPAAIKLAQTLETTAGNDLETTKFQIDKLNTICMGVIELFNKELTRLSK